MQINPMCEEFRGGGYKTITVNGTTDPDGNLVVWDRGNLYPYGFFFVPDSTSYDGLIIPFVSPFTGLVYLHANNFANATQAGVTLKGKIYIFYNTV